MKNPKYGCVSPLYVEWNQGPRDYQEDYFRVFSQDNRTLMVIADGMGGHSGGDLASRWTVEALVDGFKKNQDLDALIKSSINKILLKMKESGKDMGCTLVAAVLQKEKELYKLSYSWIGDSRIYLLGSTEKPTDNAKKIDEKNGKALWLLSDDDSFVWGFYLNQELTIDQLTEHPNKNQLEFSIHPRQKNIDEIIIKRIRTLNINERDKIFMCTDGIWESYRFQSDIMEHMSAENPKKIIQSHLKKSAKEERFNDNATFILAEAGEKILNQQCFPVKTKKSFIGQFIFGLLALCLFAMIFLVLIGKLDKPRKNVEPKKKVHTTAPLEAKKSGPSIVVQTPETDFYSIQVGSFPTFEEAKTYAEKFRKMDYQIGIISPEPGQKIKLYQVRIGRYKSFNEASKVKKELENQEKRVFSVKKHH
ncbi:MAG: protein phosphatase 2C domain-containing protein [Candidatus Aminicenantes bacterium]|nr:protein phosphatase 2C domain-containing protein [Candidatus Aminicenantes bacterium]